LTGPLPSVLTATLSNLIYFEKKALPQALANRLIRLAAFQNPEFSKPKRCDFRFGMFPGSLDVQKTFPITLGCRVAALMPQKNYFVTTEFNAN
jgi:hypothetical protein